MDELPASKIELIKKLLKEAKIVGVTDLITYINKYDTKALEDERMQEAVYLYMQALIRKAKKGNCEGTKSERSQVSQSSAGQSLLRTKLIFDVNEHVRMQSYGTDQDRLASVKSETDLDRGSLKVNNTESLGNSSVQYVTYESGGARRSANQYLRVKPDRNQTYDPENDHVLHASCSAENQSVITHATYETNYIEFRQYNNKGRYWNEVGYETEYTIETNNYAILKEPNLPGVERVTAMQAPEKLSRYYPAFPRKARRKGAGFRGKTEDTFYGDWSEESYIDYYHTPKSDRHVEKPCRVEDCFYAECPLYIEPRPCIEIPLYVGRKLLIEKPYHPERICDTGKPCFGKNLKRFERESMSCGPTKCKYVHQRKDKAHGRGDGPDVHEADYYDGQNYCYATPLIRERRRPHQKKMLYGKLIYCDFIPEYGDVIHPGPVNYVPHKPKHYRTHRANRHARYVGNPEPESYGSHQYYGFEKLEVYPRDKRRL